jgi:hypothetical protein
LTTYVNVVKPFFIILDKDQLSYGVCHWQAFPT